MKSGLYYGITKIQEKKRPRRKTSPENTNTTQPQKPRDPSLIAVRDVDDLLLLLLLLAGRGSGSRRRRGRGGGGDKNIVVVLSARRALHRRRGDGLPDVLAVAPEEELPERLLLRPFVAIRKGDTPVGVAGVGVARGPSLEVLLALHIPVRFPGGDEPVLHQAVGLVGEPGEDLRKIQSVSSETYLRRGSKPGEQLTMRSMSRCNSSPTAMATS